MNSYKGIEKMNNWQLSVGPHRLTFLKRNGEKKYPNLSFF